MNNVSGASPQALTGPEGDAALQQLMARCPLLAFDLDGTLAPIVSRPGDARVPQALAHRLARLARLRPVVVVTGRRVADARGRLGFEPAALIGSHGAEDEQDPAASARFRAVLDPLRDHLQHQRQSLESAGVQVEDKGQSIALHYRLAADPQWALAVLETQLHALLREPSPLRAFGGKYVVNLVAADAPDKAQAVRALLNRWRCDSVFFAGDDVNDEPVFAAAPAHWLTLRVGTERQPTHARWAIDAPDSLAQVLDRMEHALQVGRP